MEGVGLAISRGRREHVRIEKDKKGDQKMTTVSVDVEADDHHPSWFRTTVCEADDFYSSPKKGFEKLEISQHHSLQFQYEDDGSPTAIVIAAAGDSEEEGEEDDDDDVMRYGGGKGKIEQWKEQYSSSQRILLVGEGDFSFSLCLAKAFSSASAANIISTSIDTLHDLAKKYSNGIDNVRELEERGCVVLCGVDATNMSQHFFLRTQRFDRIVYNFPHAGFHFPEANACQIKLNKRLVKGFLRNAKVLLKKDKGEIHITHKDGDPYDRWDLVKKGEKEGLILHESIPFYKNKYVGYDPKRAHGRSSDASFGLGKCTTFKFRHAIGTVHPL